MSEDYLKLIELERFHHTKLFPKKDFVITRGKGALLYDEKGNEYIDCVAGHAVVNIGHSHPKYIEAMKNQLDKLVMIPPGFPVEERAILLKKLADMTPKPLNQIFLSNSGTESIESALKLVLAARRDIKKPEIIAFKRDFHGRTLGSLAMTHNMKYRKAFMAWLSPYVKYASFGDIDSVKELVNENTAAIFTELIQGEGGVHPAPEEFPKALRELCNEKNLILVDDEVQTGLGRTGKMFAFEHYGIVPDVICLAKAIAGGLPMGATISSEDLYNKFEIGEHNTTFGGNPLVCAAANATIDIIREEKLVENAAKQGEKIISDLSKFKEECNVIRDVRGKGLMIGVEYRYKVKDLISKAEAMRVLFLNAGLTVIRLVPPLVINDNQVKKVLDVMYKISE
ncbi:MAG: aspartate aminotransferase family protein [Promethearchaeota archaeon]|nr:MAG: aspartate aminotransferase family protein [Candidatus Lokiarchaeota archaeon]